MAGTTRQLLHHVSALDGSRQPYLVCSTTCDKGSRLPAVLYLHDTLPDPSPEGFLEDAYRTAAEWMPVISASEPHLFVQPFGRGNGGWLGAGGRDLFDLLATLRHQFPLDEERTSLLGVGAGGTGALQLASWFPHRFSAVAAIGAWTDSQWDLPLGAKDWPRWERVQRHSVTPTCIAKNLRGFPVYLEHPWWFNGFEGTTSRAHFDAMRAALEKAKAKLRLPSRDDRVQIARRAPDNPTDTLHWLLSHSRLDHPRNAHFSVFQLRASEFSWGRVHRIARAGTPGSVEVKSADGHWKIKTSGIEALEVTTPRPASKLELDRQTLFLQETEGAPVDPLRLERIGKEWRRIPTSEGNASDSLADAHGILKTPSLAGPPMDLRWDRVLFVSGSLGDQAENRATSGILERLRRRWRQGSDSPNCHPGNKYVALDYPLVLDSEVTEEQMANHHLVLAGHPHCHLLLARYAGGLPCRWTGQGGNFGEQPTMQLAGKRHGDSQDVAFFLCPNPEFPSRYLLVIGVNHADALAHADKVDTAFLPDFLVHRAHVVLDWGYFDSDWRAD